METLDRFYILMIGQKVIDMAIFNEYDTTQSKVKKMYEYMKDRGLEFSSVNLTDSSPYAILKNKTSIGYRDTSKWGKRGIVFFCARDGIDKNSLVSSLGLSVEDNSTDRVRPFAVFIPDQKFEAAVAILLNNANSASAYKTSNKKSKKESYQNKFWDEYYQHVMKCLHRDGYSNSPGSTETAVRDTFFLERKSSRDFLSWFENEITLSAAKEEVKELLVLANRKSNLALDIKYYSRDLDYFYEFIKGDGGALGQAGDDFKIVQVLNNEKRMYIVQDTSTGDLFVEKQYDVYSEEVYDRLRELTIKGLPMLFEVNNRNGKLYTREEYVHGKDLYKLFEENGPFDEDLVIDITLKVCDILEGLHGLNPPLIHRDIKPSNIMLKSNGEVILVDFNASRIDDKRSNQDTVIYGTQYFGAPEQLTGYDASDCRADIFGIGATMTFLLTGMYHNQIIAPGKYYEVWKKCLNMDKNNRYSSVNSLRQAILDIKRS